MGLLESMTMPESYSDWDADPDLDVAGHLAKWHEVFAEMFIMVLMQLISNLIMLIPFFVLGKNTILITLDYQINEQICLFPAKFVSWLLSKLRDKRCQK